MKKSDREEIRKELADIGSTLNPNEGKGGFITPESYFDTLPSAIQERIYKKQSIVSIFDSVYGALKPAFITAAGILLIALSLGILLLREGKENGQFTETWTEDYLHSEYYSLYADLDPYFFYNMAIESELTTEEILFGINDGYDQNRNEALLDYIYKTVDYYGLDAETVLPPEN